MKSQIKDIGEKHLFTCFILACLILTMFIPGCGQPPEPPKLASPPSPSPSHSPSPSPGHSFGLTVSKAPRVGETTEVTFTIDVFQSEKLDINIVWIELERYDPAIFYPKGRIFEDPHAVVEGQPETFVALENVLVDGDLTWEGDPLKRGEKLR
ncbi:hypothetical protein ACFLVF_02405 [Chloroflexota bacterium]